MKRIRITRDNTGKVQFETVTVDPTENVFFLNLDTQEEHWPTLAPTKLGKAPSSPSDKCFPQPQYGCKFHANEKGIIIMISLPSGPKPGKPGTGKPAMPGKPVRPGKPAMPGKPATPGKPPTPGRPGRSGKPGL